MAADLWQQLKDCITRELSDRDLNVPALVDHQDDPRTIRIRARHPRTDSPTEWSAWEEQHLTDAQIAAATPERLAAQIVAQWEEP